MYIFIFSLVFKYNDQTPHSREVDPLLCTYWSFGYKRSPHPWGKLPHTRNTTLDRANNHIYKKLINFVAN